MWLELRLSEELELEDKEQGPEAEPGWAPACRSYPRKRADPPLLLPNSKASLTKLVSDHEACCPQGPRHSQQVSKVQGVGGWF